MRIQESYCISHISVDLSRIDWFVYTEAIFLSSMPISYYKAKIDKFLYFLNKLRNYQEKYKDSIVSIISKCNMIFGNDNSNEDLPQNIIQIPESAIHLIHSKLL